MEELRKLYIDMFELHVGTKTNDTVFHKASEAFYETLFDAVHGSEEAMQDSKQAKPVDAMMARKQAYTILEQAKKIIEGMVNSNKDMGVDNTLRGLVDKLGFDCGNARALAGCKEESKEEEVIEESKEDKVEESTETPDEEKIEESEEETTEESPEEDVEEDLMSSQMEKDSGYTYSSKEEDKKNPSKEDELNKKRKGSTEYTVVSIMP